MKKVAIIDYGAGNIKSLQFALERLDVASVVSNNTSEIINATHVIFPGVGAAGKAMEQLRSSGLDIVIPKLKQPVLGICLGMQLMCRFSEENDTNGLGIFEESVVRFPALVKIPHMGWNQLTNMRSPLFSGIEEGAYIYMVHSYYVPQQLDTIATTTYGAPYSAALNKDNFYGVQFHPEKSGEVGATLLQNFLAL
ncbi:imidazole glycerol phosphate synthase subunit HisH [Altibacter sp. HG106]|uniref:imidazole glycerol phosphate synthase subunit HisH n=1 Tax=Altibacter sp. HG106 TaxID=3023937 RepID=UPI002350E03A|nr:imidazole glycerol phosphate synthase subunit HisH [Altibacter sp. HG106]MDC7993590.1 imidazole glycerol phosphate synthase subunit HisH [Altibacter sp. HG106]